MFSKEKFCKIISSLRAANKLQSDVDELYRQSRDNLDCDFMNAAALQINHESIVVELLEYIMNDDTNMISYFIYELDYGGKYVDGMITEFGKNINISSAEKLYDYLAGQEQKKG
jgi:hypothetical protein